MQLRLNQGGLFLQQYYIEAKPISSVIFEHTGEDWIRVTDEFDRWCWYRGVVAPDAAGEVTVMAESPMFSCSENWEVCIGTNMGTYGSAGVAYSETRSVSPY